MGHRKKPARIVDLNSFVADATALHRTITKYSHGLRPGCDHARALDDLHEALLKAIRDITGDEVPWAKTPPAHMTVAAPWNGTSGG
jgi:hypothetical protein